MALFITTLCIALTSASCAKPKDGSPGLQGATGAVGPQGPSGAAAAETTVQFCPNAGPTAYPNTFPEYGLCINGNIFAVYYDGKNAWLAEIVPGYYASTSTSAPCNFTVSANCQVQEQ